jgi:hypothetical protein
VQIRIARGWNWLDWKKGVPQSDKYIIRLFFYFLIQ